MKIDYMGYTDRGQVREQNEDAILTEVNEKAALFLVADGMGGEKHGRECSEKIRQGYQKWWNDRFLPLQDETSFAQALDSLGAELRRVNWEIVLEYGEHTSGSTLVLLFLFRGKYACFSIGDSRIYRMFFASVEAVTQDDIAGNLYNTRVSAADRDKLTGAVGLRRQADFSLQTGTLKRHETFFLCSDGAYRCVRPRLFHAALFWGGQLLSAERAVRLLKFLIEKGGADDNYSLIAVNVYERKLSRKEERR